VRGEVRGGARSRGEDDHTDYPRNAKNEKEQGERLLETLL